MALGDVISRLSVVLGLDTAAFERGNTQAQKQLARTQREFDKVGKNMQRVGRNLSAYLTVPILAIGAGALKMAGDFEGAMNGVAISTQATGEDLERLKSLALDIGSSTIFGAKQAAGAMEDLAKIGLSTEQILGGAAKAAADLAAATGSDLEPAAIAVADTLQQFKMNVSDLPAVVNQITGAVNQSKLGFDDYQLAIGQAGGVAGALGVDFTDFNAVLASTSALFASGSDAGTSFKRFLTRLTPISKAAADAMDQYGLEFFNANGSMKSMAEIAQLLQDRLGGLSEEAKTDVLKRIFGVDAMRTAIGLMDQGAAGIDNIAKKIRETDAAAQSAERMKGFNAQMKELGGAFETLAIRVADAGVLTALTGLITKIGDFVAKLAELDPAILNAGLAVAGFVAALGPLWLVFGTGIRAIGLMLPLLVKLAPVFTALIPVIAAVGKALIGLAIAGGPITLIVLAAGAVYLAFKNWDTIGPIVQRVYNAVKTWLVDKFNGIVNSVREKIDSVIGFFRNMWDRVVGNSYVPDMVEAIGHHMARLDALMVQPAKTAASKTEQAFRDLQQSAQTLFARLFPEQVAGNRFLADIKLLRDYAAAAKLPVEQLDEALRRLRNEHFGESGEPSIMSENISLVKDTSVDFAKISDALVKKAEMTKDAIIRAYADMAQGVVNNLRGLVDQIKKGDILGALQTILATVSGVVDTLIRVGVIKTPAASPSASVPTYASGTNFHPGGLAIVGERGPELVSMPRGSRVFTNRESFGERQRIEIVPSSYFDVVVDGRAARVAAPMAGQAAMAGAAGGMVGVYKRQGRQIP